MVSVDWLGHGESAKPQDIARYHVRELGRDLLAIIGTLGLGRVHLVAHDYGRRSPGKRWRTTPSRS